MDIEEKVIKVIHEFLKYKREEISINNSLKKDLGLDSLDVLMLVFDVERKFKIDFPDHVIKDFITVGDLVNSVKNAKPLKREF